MAKPLNDLVEFDCPFRVAEDGKVETGPLEGVYVPSVYHDDESDVVIDDAAWWAWSAGYTGQWGYSGPVMHASEYLGGRMERDLLDDPGVYVVVVVLTLDSEDDAGWIVLKREEQ